MWNLLVHSDEDVRDFAANVVRGVVASIPLISNPIKVGNLHEAEQSFADWEIARCDLVVLEATAPATREASVGSSPREPVLQFVRQVKRRRPELPMIVLAPSPDEALRAFLTAFEATAHVEMLPDWRDGLRNRAEELLKNLPPAEQAHLQLDITLAGRQRTNWCIRRTGDSSFRDFGELHVDSSELARLVRRSKALADQASNTGWQAQLSDLSSDLGQLLFDNALENKKLWRKFVNHRAQVGGVENTRVRVTLSDETHPVMIEALKDDDDPDFWMLRAPIFRRYECPMARNPLFKDPASRNGPINCLVIQADPSPGNIPDGPWAGPLRALPQIESEASDLMAIFEQVRNTSGGVVDRLSIGEVAGDPIDAMIAKLRERHWHIIHFAGHGVASDRDEAALVLAPERGGVVRVADLADKLVGTQFLFLSSCKSASAYVVLRAVENMVPALLGFRWAVPDKSAADFARAFYRALFARGRPSYKYVEYAFMCARRAIHDRNSSDPTWASPVLVMQLP
jgi:hypothetical protein